MRCLKSFGEPIAARDPDRQTAEIHIRLVRIDRLVALGLRQERPRRPNLKGTGNSTPHDAFPQQRPLCPKTLSTTSSMHNRRRDRRLLQFHEFI